MKWQSKNNVVVQSVGNQGAGVSPDARRKHVASAGSPISSRRKFSKWRRRITRAVSAGSSLRGGGKGPAHLARELAAGMIKSAANFALSDWPNPPEIHNIERVNGSLLVYKPAIM
ncbi:hypothetical protein [Candidatus Villigracilis affinis]|uniref:hypothetical protein n=1 Tax=Candidatus Villigracilis affinis TaxID=3140682 RepID=UPI002A1D4962|nr:hypothetical protein [Anaerolineales bacterium]